MNVLTNQVCINAKCDQQQILKLYDGGGLYLWVYADGRKFWRLRYWQGGKEKSLSLGVYPSVGLEEARARRDEQRKLLNANLDPSAERKVAKKDLPKRVSHKNQFKLTLSDGGELTIETSSRVVTLTKQQSEALRAFLLATEA